MSTETQVSPDAETQNPAPEVVEPEITTPEADANAEHEAEPEGDDADKALKRMQRRIDKRTADVYRTRAENEQLKARLTELEAKSGPTDKPAEQADPVAMAREMSRVERFTEKANAIVTAGTKAHADYMVTLRGLASEVGEFVKPNGAPSQFMEVVLEVSDKPEAVLYHLGKNPDLAEELTDLSPIRLAKKLASIERELTESAKPQSSKAPKPLEPVKGRASDSDLGPGLSDAEWMKRREAQIREQRGR